MDGLDLLRCASSWNDCAVLVGRDQEQAAIAAALERASAGTGELVLLSGSPGIGKSTLARAVAERARDAGFAVHVGRATEYERALPYGVWIDALGDLLQGLGTAAAAQSLDAYGVQRELRARLTALAAGQPLLVVLDDLHWSDDATLASLAALVRRPAEGPVLIVGVHRPLAALDDISDELVRQGGVGLRLAPLADADAAALLGDVLGPADREAVLEQAAGNPFYLQQLARSPAAGGLDAQSAGMPQAIAASIRQEVDGLSAPARQLLRGAAVAGPPVDLRLAAVAADLDYPAALDALDELVRSELLVAADASTAFAFRHPLVRRAVYEGAGAGWRIAAHTRLREALVELGADPTLIAHHVEHGATIGDEAGVQILSDAARVVDGAPEVAAAWLAAALRLLPGERAAERAALQERRGVALLAAGDLVEAHRALLAAGGDTADQLWRLAEVERWLGHDRDAVRRLERARELSDPANPLARVKTEIELMLVHEWNLRHADAQAAAEAAIDAAQASGDPVLIGEVRGVMATTLVQTEPRAAAPHYEAATETVRRYADETFPAHPMSLWDLGWAATYLERFDEAIEHFDRGARIARGRQMPGNAVMLLTDRAEPRYRAGRVAEAIELAEEAVEAARATPSPRYVWWALMRLGLILARAGHTERADEVVQECEALARRLPPSPLVGLWTAQARAAAASARGEHEDAARVLAAAAGGPDLPLLPPIDGNRPRQILVEAALARGDDATAARWVDDAAAWARASGLHAQKGWALTTRALVERASGNVGAAASTAGRAVTSYDQGGAALEAARAQLLAASCLDGLGQRGAAAELVRMAEARCHELGALVDQARAARELRRMGKRPPLRATAPARGLRASAAGPTDERLASLTGREREVAEQVASGATNRQIAEALFLSEKTVESHLRNIFAKVGVSSRGALAAEVNREAPAAS